MPDVTISPVSRRHFLASLGVLTAGVGLGLPVLSACSGPSSAAGGEKKGGTPKAGGVLNIGVTSISPYLNPLTSTNSRIGWVTDPIVETLYTYAGTSGSAPYLAQGEPSVSGDGLTWTVKLKPDIKFSNGDPLTADHVAAVITFVSNPKSFSDWTSYFAGYVKSAEAVASDTVQINLTKPYGILRSHLINLPIIHKDYVSKTDTTVGTGPFKIKQVTQEQSVELEPNDLYHADKSKLDGIVFTGISDPGTRLVNLREGKISIMLDVPPENVSLLKNAGNIDVHVVDAPIDIVTYMVTNKPPFDSVKVRQALAYGMDRKGVRDVVYAGAATNAQGRINPAAEGYNPDAADYPEEPDADKVRSLLEEAGVKNLKFSLKISTSSNTMKNVAQVLVEGWKKVGIEATLQTQDTSAWVQDWAAGKYDVAMTIYESGFGGGRTAFTVLAPVNSAQPLNFGYKNASVDELMAKAWATNDAAERAEFCSQMDKLLAQDAMGLPPVYPKFIVAQRTDLTPLNKDLLTVGRVDASAVQFLG